jgi:hypothetical protein
MDFTGAFSRMRIRPGARAVLQGSSWSLASGTRVDLRLCEERYLMSISLPTIPRWPHGSNPAPARPFGRKTPRRRRRRCGWSSGKRPPVATWRASTAGGWKSRTS